jgi:hypothetical protein
VSGRKLKKPHPGKTSLGGAPTLRGWKAIAEYLAQPAGTAQRWQRDGMPVRRVGRSVVADPAELNTWLQSQSHATAPLTIATPAEDLIADLGRGLKEARKKKRTQRGS